MTYERPILRVLIVVTLLLLQVALMYFQAYANFAGSTLIVLGGAYILMPDSDPDSKVEKLVSKIISWLLIYGTIAVFSPLLFRISLWYFPSLKTPAANLIRIFSINPK